MISIPLWQTAEHACSYLDDRLAKSVMADPAFPIDTSIYSALIDQGFRRSGDQVYKPYCHNCRECVPSRIIVREFQADRRQRRCLLRNARTQVTIRPAEFDTRHFDLYQRYQTARHSREKENDTGVSPEEYMQFLGSSWCNTLFVEFTISDRLAAVAVVDALEQGLSAVYTFFDPDFAGFSPGVFAVLWQIQHAELQKLDYVYLGFWIKDSPKMRYKNQYQPLQGLIEQQWRPISSHA
ncbi:MAG: arginyltransferase [Methylococcales bacterium]|nr:arginyltransferase [Methylococcales bacterium]